MAKPRCKDTSIGSFFGHFLYKRKVPGEHFLRKLDIGEGKYGPEKRAEYFYGYKDQISPPEAG